MVLYTIPHNMRNTKETESEIGGSQKLKFQNFEILKFWTSILDQE